MNPFSRFPVLQFGLAFFSPAFSSLAFSAPPSVNYRDRKRPRRLAPCRLDADDIIGPVVVGNGTGRVMYCSWKITERHVHLQHLFYFIFDVP